MSVAILAQVFCACVSCCSVCVMSASSKSWQGWTPRGEGDDAREADFGSDVETDTNWAVISQEDAADYLHELLVSLKLDGKINATQCCVLSFFASKAGIKHEGLQKLAVHPDSASGSFSSAFDDAIGVKTRDPALYEVGVGLKTRFASRRNWTDVVTLPPHELMASELLAHPEYLDTFRKAKADGDLPELYTSHPIVQASPDEDILPVCIFRWCRFREVGLVSCILGIFSLEPTCSFSGCSQEERDVLLWLQWMVLDKAHLGVSQMVVAFDANRGVAGRST